MSNVDKSLSEQFGVDPVWDPKEISFPLVEQAEASVPSVINAEASTEQNDDDKMNSDIEFSRQKLLALLSKGEDAFEYLLHLAKSEERVNAFEVLNSMLSNMTDMSMKIIDIHEKKKKLNSNKKDETNSSGGSTTNNNIIFTGTTNDLQEYIKKFNKGDSPDVIEGE